MLVMGNWSSAGNGSNAGNGGTGVMLEMLVIKVMLWYYECS